MPEKKTSINPMAQNCSTKKYSAFIQETIKILKDDFLAKHGAGKTVEEIRGAYGIEERHILRIGLQHVPVVDDWMVSADSAGCLLQRIGTQVHQVDDRMGDREAALIEKIAGTDSYIEMRIRDVFIVKIEYLLSRTLKNALHFEKQDFPIIDRQKEIRVDGGSCNCFL